MGFKENFKQAAQELMRPPLPADQEEKEAPGPETAREPWLTEESVRRVPPVVEPVRRQAADLLPPDPAVTVIARGDELRGDLSCTGDFALYGTLVGTVAGGGGLLLCGALTGDAQGTAAAVRGGFVKGNLAVAGPAEVDGASVVLGDIKARTLTLSGRVKGNLIIEEALVLAETAVVLGKITTGRLTVADGALLQGEVNIPTEDFDLPFRAQEKPDQSRRAF